MELLYPCGLVLCKKYSATNMMCLAPIPPFSSLSATVSVNSRWEHRVHTEWQWPHSIMMEKLARASEVGGCTPTPFHYIYHHVQSCSVRSSWNGRYTHPISSLSLYVLCGWEECEKNTVVGEGSGHHTVHSQAHSGHLSLIWGEAAST